jgi:hypothetical protein
MINSEPVLPGIYEDIGLLISGLTAALLLLIRNGKINEKSVH